MPTKDRPWIRERRPTLARSGSQNRKRSLKRSTALTEEEAKAFDALVDRAGTTASDLIRCAVFALPLSRAKPRPTVNHQVAARLFAELQNVAYAYRQAADAAEPGKYDALLDAATRDLSEMRIVWFQAMGREP